MEIRGKKLGCNLQEKEGKTTTSPKGRVGKWGEKLFHKGKEGEGEGPGGPVKGEGGGLHN